MLQSGFINIIKPTGMTSSDVVCKVKKMLKLKKIGHLGTLDPAASGVLPLAFGKATKFFDYFLKKDKVYVADVKFGVLTDTLDSFGLITEQNDKVIKKEDIENVLNEFIGKIEQVPPMYSAIKINGKKACDLARDGQEIELKAREIEIYSIELLGEISENFFRFKVHCTAGTYIRTLFNDIAMRLETVATTNVIIRAKSGLFRIENAITLEEVDEKNCVSIDNVFEAFNKFEITNTVILKKLLNGVKLNKSDLGIETDDCFFLTHQFKIIGMYHFDQDKLICDVFLVE